MSHRPVDLEIDEQERCALLRTCKLAGEPPLGGRLLVIDLLTGALVLDIDSAATELGQDHLALLDDRVLSISGEWSGGKIEFVNLAAAGGLRTCAQRC